MSGVEAKDEAVEAALDQYVTRLEAMDDEGAGDAAERLMAMDCAVCAEIGQHLAALVVALLTAPGPKRQATLRETAIETATELSDDLL